MHLNYILGKCEPAGSDGLAAVRLAHIDGYITGSLVQKPATMTDKMTKHRHALICATNSVYTDHRSLRVRCTIRRPFTVGHYLLMHISASV